MINKPRDNGLNCDFFLLQSFIRLIVVNCFFPNPGYLWILGRGKDLIISGGLNVYPKEVEDTIDSLPYIQESAVIGE